MHHTMIIHYLQKNLQFVIKCCQIIVKNIGDKYKIKVGDVKNLIQNLGSKTNYVLHYRDLQLYLSLGMKLTKIQRVLKFKQCDWMKKYIDFNTEKRKNAANSFEKDFLKLMINTIYGKAMEKLWKRINVRLETNKNALADQHILLIKSLVKIVLRFMKLSQF